LGLNKYSKEDTTEWAVNNWRVYEAWKAEVLNFPEAIEPLGYVYFVQAGPVGIKIGFTASKDVLFRIDQLQVGNPYKLRLLGVIRGSRRDERKLHELFEPWRMQGEWFKARAPGLRELIDELSTRLPV
jgi:hypothetical protein